MAMEEKILQFIAKAGISRSFPTVEELKFLDTAGISPVLNDGNVAGWEIWDGQA